MSKYDSLWKYVKNSGKDELKLSFEEIEKVLGISMDHSFLTYKHELEEYGYTVKKISIKEKTASFALKKQGIVVYVHGKGGNRKEAERYKKLFNGYDVVGIDYKSQTPWQAQKEFPKTFKKITSSYEKVILIANSIGAYFCMCSLNGFNFEKCFFISPVVDMEKLIKNMMLAASVSEKDLKEQGRIKTDFGETLSWEYLCYVRENEIKFHQKTFILYGENDNLTDFETIKFFAEKIGAKLTLMKSGEHFFHTQPQMEFLDKWIEDNLE